MNWEYQHEGLSTICFGFLSLMKTVMFQPISKLLSKKLIVRVSNSRNLLSERNAVQKRRPHQS